MLWIFCYFRRALALENANAALFYHSKNSLYHYTILFYNSSSSQNSISIKILFFNISLLFCHFFKTHISQAFQPSLFFNPASPSTFSNTQPINNHSHGTKNPSHQTTQATDQPINNHSHSTKNPSAHAVDSKPTGANPLKKIIIGHSQKKKKKQPPQHLNRSTATELPDCNPPEKLSHCGAWWCDWVWCLSLKRWFHR